MACSFRVTTCLWMLLLLLAGGRLLPAAEPPTESDTELDKLDARINRFLEGVSGNDAQNAYEDLLTDSQLLQQKALPGLIEKTAELKKYGKCHGFEQIAVKPVGADLVLMKYLYKCEDFPVVWYFSFYRTPAAVGTAAANGPWRVVSVQFDTRLELLWF